MKNDEFLFKMETIIEYLKMNGGYDYKLYNRICCDKNNEPDSNIVEYAEDIKNYWKSLKYNSNLETYIKFEICEFIKNNLELFSADDTKLINLKKYCKSKIDQPITPTHSNLLIEFVKEALLDLLLSELSEKKSK